jgi:hypothetical protein
MTAEEHGLMIMMFARQTLLIRALKNALQSHGILSDDDFKAFAAFEFHAPPQANPVVLETLRVYLEVARVSGLDVPIEEPEK